MIGLIQLILAAILAFAALPLLAGFLAKLTYKLIRRIRGAP